MKKLFSSLNPEFTIGFRQNVSKSLPILRYAHKIVLGVSYWIRLRVFCSHALSCQRFRPFFSKPIAKSGLKGFTLVEIMLAAAILVAVMAAFLSSFTSTFKSTNYSQGISLAGRAAENKVEEMVNFTFDSLMAQYGANGTGRNFTFNASGLTGAGIVNVTDRKDLYGGGETLVNSSAGWAPRSFASGLVYDNRMWIMGGSGQSPSYKSDIWYSTNGKSWSCANSNASWSASYGRTAAAVLVYDNKMWIIAGSILGTQPRDVWYSTNGVNWTLATNNSSWTSREGHAALVYDNRMWMLGGSSGGGGVNDVWYSYDGANWTQAMLHANWTARYMAGALVYDNKMWIMGGTGGTDKKNDVWYSANGTSWICATPNAGWSPRLALSALVYDNKMWVFGGRNDTGNVNDVWYSTNGVNWTRAVVNASWSPRMAVSALVYDNKMWIIAGSSSSGYKNDVWSSPGYNRILEAAITISWRHPDNRTFGEDANFDGFWDNATEDVNGNGIYDSPARLRQLLVEDSTTGKLRRIYMGR